MTKLFAPSGQSQTQPAWLRHRPADYKHRKLQLRDGRGRLKQGKKSRRLAPFVGLARYLARPSPLFRPRAAEIVDNWLANLRFAGGRSLRFDPGKIPALHCFYLDNLATKPFVQRPRSG